MRRFTLPVLALLALSSAACGSSSSSDDTGAGAGGDVPDAGGDDAATDAGSDVDNGAPSTTYPAAHPAFPVLTNQAGGPILQSPKVYLVFYPGYPYETQLKDLAQKIGASTYWSSAVHEYGVGPIAYVDSIELTGETAPTTITDKDVDSFMNQKIAAGAFGTPDPYTVYTIFYPDTTTITMSGGFLGNSQSCSSFGGYHSDTTVTVNGTKRNYAYAVIPTCASFGALTGVDGVTGALSHEWAEASTDPFPSTNNGAQSAYSGVDNDHFIWNLLGGAENGDLCAQRDDAFFKPAGFDYTVQACWSNKAAKAGGDPCAPKGTKPYFNSAPVLDDEVTLDLTLLGAGKIQTKGVQIAQGASKTVEVDLFSDADTGGAWKVKAVDALAQFTKGSPTLDFAWDRTTGQNGEKLHVTITVTGKSAFGGAHPFLVVSQLGGQQQLWPALVTE